MITRHVCSCRLFIAIARALQLQPTGSWQLFLCSYTYAYLFRIFFNLKDDRRAAYGQSLYGQRPLYYVEYPADITSRVAGTQPVL